MSQATAPHPTHPERDIRQRQIVPPQKLAACHAVVIGVGAIGRQAALQLAAVGLHSLELFDFDTVAVENLAPQAYWPQDLGRPKVEATADVCRLIHPEGEVSVHPERFRRSDARCFGEAGRVLAIFCCVDSITARGLIWESVKDRAGFFADGRMSAEVIRVLASDAPPVDGHYAATLFAAAQAYAGSCTARSTVYAASIAAGLMLAQFTRWLRGLPVERDVLLNLLSMELTAAGDAAGCGP
jgi:molybdopterin-synthase adenylyltransferase